MNLLTKEELFETFLFTTNDVIRTRVLIARFLYP